MKNTVFLLENEKGKKDWIEVSDQSFWGNPSVGHWIFVGRKQWQLKAILNEQVAVPAATQKEPTSQKQIINLKKDGICRIDNVSEGYQLEGPKTLVVMSEIN